MIPLKLEFLSGGGDSLGPEILERAYCQEFVLRS